MDQPYRNRKLDLSLHLIANLSSVIVLKCAHRPDTTDLLRQLQANALPNWTPCYLKANANLDFSWILEELLKVLRKPATDSMEVLSSLMEEQLLLLERRQRVIVLLLDDAGVLMPGLLEVIVQYTRLHPRLKLVCALSPDEIEQKATTDGGALVDAHVISINAQHDAGFSASFIVKDPTGFKSNLEIASTLVSWIQNDQHRLGAVLASSLAIAGLGVWALWPGNKPSGPAVLSVQGGDIKAAMPAHDAEQVRGPNPAPTQAASNRQQPTVSSSQNDVDIQNTGSERLLELVPPASIPQRPGPAPEKPSQSSENPQVDPIAPNPPAATAPAVSPPMEQTNPPPPILPHAEKAKALPRATKPASSNKAKTKKHPRKPDSQKRRDAQALSQPEPMIPAFDQGNIDKTP